MNCKPGDLAIVIRGPDKAYIPVGAIVLCLHLNSGKFLEVVDGRGEVVDLIDGETFWDVEWRGQRTCNLGFAFGVADSDLRPIRDPDQDAQDETLSWLPVPSGQKELA